MSELAVYRCSCGKIVGPTSLHFQTCEVVAKRVAEFEAWEAVCSLDWFKAFRA